MGFLKRIFGGSDDGAATPSGAPAEDDEWRRSAEASFDSTADRHRVTVWLRLYDASFETTREQLRVFALENELMRALDEAGVGEHDTNTLERGYIGIRLVGNDADAIVDVIMPLLTDVPEGTYLAVRRGPKPTQEDRIDLGEDAGGVDDSDAPDAATGTGAPGENAEARA